MVWARDYVTECREEGLNKLVEKGLSGKISEVCYNVRTFLICSPSPW